MTRLGLLLGIFVIFSSISAFSYEEKYYRNENGGFFMISLSADDFGIISADTVFPVSGSDNVFGLFASTNLFTPDVRIQKKLCHANLRVIQGAIEMYNMDHKEYIRKLDDGVLKDLVAQQYLKNLPVYQSCNCKYTSSGDVSGSGKIFCELHGDVENSIMPMRKDEPNNASEKSGLVVLGRFKSGSSGRLRLIHKTEANVIKELNLAFPQNNGGEKELPNLWMKRQSEYLTYLSTITPGDSVYDYISEQSLRRKFKAGDVPRSRPSSSAFSRQQNPQVDLYSLTTGALAIQESLQLDRMTNPVADESDKKLSIETLKAPEIKSHPFVEMIGQKNPAVFPTDFLVPADFYSLHFSDINKQIAFSDLVDQWGSNLLHTMQLSAHDAQIKEKYMRQLCLEMSELTKMFGDKVVADLVICGADPFLNEGTDFSVIFSIRNKTIFDLNISRNFQNAKTLFKDFHEETLKIEEIPVYSLTTSDRRLHSFSCDLDQFKVFSNSKQAIQGIIETFKKKIPSLGKADDYRYMRTIFPADENKEDIFCYLSDGHIRRLVGPVWKIGRQRRIQCVNTLRIIQNAISFFHLEGESGPVNLENLLAKRFIENSYLHCPDGGKYSVDGPDNEPLCSFHGRLRYATPILDAPPVLISQREYNDYRKFVEEYNRYWSKYFDPVGIRGKISSTVVELETCILPLIENSVYDQFKRMSGGNKISMNFPLHPKTIFQFFCKLNLPEILKSSPDVGRNLDELSEKTKSSTGEIVNSFGDGISINFVDSDLKFSLDFAQGDTSLPIFRDTFSVLMGVFFISSFNLPTYAIVNVKDEKRVERFIKDYLRVTTQENAVRRPGFFNERFYGYESNYDAGKPHVYTMDFQIFILHLRTFFAVYKGNLLITNQRKLLTELMENSSEASLPEANFGLNIIFNQFDKISEVSGIAWQEKMRSVCLNNLGSLYALRQFRGIKQADWKKMSLLINGYIPFCPSGGEYMEDTTKGMIRCSVHENHFWPRQPFSPDPSVPINAFIGNLKKLQTSLNFTPEGIMTKVIMEK